MTLRDKLKNLVRFRCASPTKHRSGGGGVDFNEIHWYEDFDIHRPYPGLKKTCKLVV